jgi:hypothetical protein
MSMAWLWYLPAKDASRTIKDFIFVQSVLQKPHVTLLVFAINMGKSLDSYLIIGYIANMRLCTLTGTL